MTACGSVFDDLEPCVTGVEMRFVYDYNLEQANAFPSQVDCLTLHIYDASGKFVTTVEETSAVLADESWRMSLQLAPGRYSAVAYGGIACDKASFAHEAVPAAGSSVGDIAMNIRDSHIGTRLHDHFHGELDFNVTSAEGAYNTVTMRMKKTTNHFRILLHHIDNTPVDGRDYTFTISDRFHVLDHSNNPVGNEAIAYPAWVTGQTPAADADARADGNMAGAAGYAELSTSRLHLSAAPVLSIVHNESGREIVRLPLNTYLLMTKSDAEGWTDQEYLDRCSRWNLTLFLDRDNQWSQTKIIINGWTVRINSSDF